MSAVTVAVVDYGMGNRRSVEKALEHVGARALVTRDHDELRAAHGLIVPGVGAFPLAMRNLRELGLADLIVERAGEGVPVLGICLGLQLLFDGSEELGGAAGLGLLSGTVTQLQVGEGKLPHIGWSRVAFTRPSALASGLPTACAFYHVHSYVPRPQVAHDVLGTSEYGETFASVVEHGSIFGAQFHPEKSSAHGLALLGNFTQICARLAPKARV